MKTLGIVFSLVLLIKSGTNQGEGVLESGGSVRLLDEVTVVDDTPDFTGPQLVVVERVEEADLPLAFPKSESRIAPFYRFSSDEEWWANHQGLQARIRLPERADPDGLAVQIFITSEGIEHDLDMHGFWSAVPATYDSETLEAVFSLRVLRPSGLYVTFSSGNFPDRQMDYAAIETYAWPGNEMPAQPSVQGLGAAEQIFHELIGVATDTLWDWVLGKTEMARVV